MKKLIVFAALVGLGVAIASTNAYAIFSVDWRSSFDDGQYGYQQIGTWLFNNGYAGSQVAGENIAQTGYIGYNAGDSDPFNFSAGVDTTIQVVYEWTAFENDNALGYYYATDNSQFALLGGTQNGPTSFTSANPFGFYLTNGDNDTWYTDRTKNNNNSPQALIYNIDPNKWLIAWEDLDSSSNGSDNDYNDNYLVVTVNPIPEPITLALFGLGLGGLALSRKRTKV